MDDLKTNPFKKYAVNFLLFFLTLLATLVIGVQYHISYHSLTLPAGSGFFTFLWRHPAAWLWGFAYSFSLLGILLVHELGHFFACRFHRIEATLPFFIPAPTLIGTFGAFIKIKSPFSSKKALFDVGLAGPLAGFLAALPVIFAGISLSRIVPKESLPAGISLGEPLIFKLITWLVLGPAAARQDILVHPMAFAGWFGLLATAFNLFPIGQLDGGHILHALVGKKSYHAGVASIVIIVVLGIFCWQGWLFWALIVTMVGLRHPPIYDDEKIDTKRKILAGLALLIFVLSFTPAPIVLAP
ncbi:MAG: site-2 protease family protein [Candidatus Aminicenantes bacterium]|nr:site-2 protease family protein [Candidatus Aminicenantes bacterium]